MIIKNSNTRRSLVQNKYVILLIIFAIILVLCLIQTLTSKEKEESKSKNNQIENSVITTPKVDTSSKTIISGNDVSSSKQEDNTKIVEQFISYCNNKEIENAYNLLTEECKEEVFSSNIQYFKQNYVDKIFTNKKMYSMQSWVNFNGYTTYKVKIQNDILSTGKVDSESNVIEDYYTIIEKENNYKLNINGYIGRQQKNQEVQVNGIKITVLCKDIYTEYETYDIKIENESSKTILLDSKEKVDSIYLVGSNEKNYSAYSYEIDKHDLIIEAGKSKKLTIKFNKIYSNQTIMNQMVFSDVITNYEEYEITQNKEEYTNRVKIIIEI